MHGNFTEIHLDGSDKLMIVGNHPHHVEKISTIHIAVIAVGKPEKRVEAFIDARKTKLEADWSTHAPAGPFEDGDVVVAVGAAMHSDEGTSPFLWHGHFEIGQPGEVQLVVK